MIETEKMILAIVIEYPRFVDILLANHYEDMFLGEYNEEIFQTIKRLHLSGDPFDWQSVVDSLISKIQKGYFESMLDIVRSVPESLAENLLREKISLLKKKSFQKKILSEINAQARSGLFDFDEIIEAAERGKFVELVREDPSFQVAYNDFLEWKKQKTSDIVTAIPRFDREIDGFHPGEIVGIMGRAATAKTFLAINIVNHLLMHTQKRIGFFSLEMAKGPLIERMTQVFFNISRQAIQSEKITEQIRIEEFRALYKNLRIYSKVYTVAEISKLVKRLSIKIVVIDYLQLISQPQGKNLYEKATYNIHALKEMAKNLEVTIFLLSQISRRGEGGWEPVTIDMCRDSGVIEEDCDFLIGIWNPSLKEDAGAEWIGKICLKLLKNKRGPQVGVKAWFSRDSGKILEVEEHVL